MSKAVSTAPPGPLSRSRRVSGASSPPQRRLTAERGPCDVGLAAGLELGLVDELEAALDGALDVVLDDPASTAPDGGELHATTAVAANTAAHAYVTLDIAGTVADVTTLGYAILGLLADGPRTGYEIARRMDTPIGYYWTARHSQIYPELARLEADRLVRHEVVPGPGPRDTKRYTLTRAGRRNLRQWVASPLPPQPERSELLLRTRWLWLAGPERAADFLRTVRAERQRRLDTYREEERRLRADVAGTDPDADPDDPAGPAFWRLATIANGLSYEEHLVRWCDDLLVALTVEPARR